MLQILPIALAEVQGGYTYENLLNESAKWCILFTEKKKLLRKYITI